MKSLSRRIWTLGLSLVLAAASTPAAGRGDDGQITPSRTRALLMHRHFDAAIAALDAVMRGDLSAAKANARIVITLPAPGDLPASGTPHLEALRGQAERASKAADLEQAAAATASMLAACGNCHRTVGTMPAYATPPEPTIGGILGHMKQHSVAAELLAQALTTPSSSLWTQGAEALQNAPLKRADLPDTANISRAALADEARIHGLSTRALATKDTPGRVQIYAELIVSCSTCHGANGHAGPMP